MFPRWFVRSRSGVSGTYEDLCSYVPETPFRERTKSLGNVREPVLVRSRKGASGTYENLCSYVPETPFRERTNTGTRTFPTLCSYVPEKGVSGTYEDLCSYVPEFPFLGTYEQLVSGTCKNLCSHVPEKGSQERTKTCARAFLKPIFGNVRTQVFVCSQDGSYVSEKGVSGTYEDLCSYVPETPFRERTNS